MPKSTYVHSGRVCESSDTFGVPSRSQVAIIAGTKPSRQLRMLSMPAASPAWIVRWARSRSSSAIAAGTRQLVIDLSNVSFLSSSGLVALHSAALVMRGDEPPSPVCARPGQVRSRASMNGFSSSAPPIEGTTVTYPFEGFGGAIVHRQVSGEQVYDINTDGVAQYGLYPDWVEDLRKVADAQRPGDGAQIVDDMARGAEAYLQMWERTYGVAPDSCRNPALRRAASTLPGLVRTGMTTESVLRAVGQPYQRLGSTYVFCAKTSTRARVPVRVTFSAAGRVTGLVVS